MESGRYVKKFASCMWNKDVWESVLKVEQEGAWLEKEKCEVAKVWYIFNCFLYEELSRERNGLLMAG